MKKFSFPLQFLLDYRKKKEDRLKRELAEVIAREEREKSVLRELEEKINLYREKLREKKQQEDIKMCWITYLYSYLEKLIRQADNQREKIRKISEKRGKLQEALIQAGQERKAVEKLRERRWADFIYQRGKLEQQILDESAIARFKNKTKP